MCQAPALHPPTLPLLGLHDHFSRFFLPHKREEYDEHSAAQQEVHVIENPAPQGFALYVDGLFTAQLTDPQPFFSVSGGDPIHLNGSVVLCGRTDQASDRFYHGNVAQFAIFDQALTSQSVGPSVPC